MIIIRISAQCKLPLLVLLLLLQTIAGYVAYTYIYNMLAWHVAAMRCNYGNGSIGAHKSHLVSAKLYTARHLGYTFSQSHGEVREVSAISRSEGSRRAASICAHRSDRSF